MNPDASSSDSQRSTRPLLILFLLLIASIVGAMVYYPLTWGLMDDHSNLEYVKVYWKDLSLWDVLKEKSTIWWFRPVYVFFVYVAYGLLKESPKLFYILNFFLVLSCFLPWVALLRRHVPPEHRRKAPVGQATFLFLFLLLAATPLYNLIVYLSLQEKFVILFGGGALACIDLAARDPAGPGRRWWALQAAGIASLILGLWSKPTALAYFPWAFLALLTTRGLAPARRFLSLALWTLPAVLMSRSFVNSDNPYPNKYWNDWGYRFTHLPFMVCALMVLGIVTAGVVLHGQRKSGAGFFPLSPRLLWPVSLVAYLVLMIPWGVSTYQWTPIMVLACGCLTLFGETVLEQLPRLRAWSYRIVMPVAAVAAAVVVFGVAVPRLARQSEIGTVVKWLSDRLPDPSLDLFVIEPALEATGALQYYTQQKQKFTYVLREQAAPRGRPRAWLITRDEAPISPLHARDFKKVVYRTRYWTLYER